MANQEHQKIKILRVMDILLRETDEDHPLNATQISKKLEEYNIFAERKSIYADIDILREYGLDIEKTASARGGYYIASRDFEKYDLKILVDSISASRFIDQKDIKKLVNNLSKLTNKYEAKELNRELVIPNRHLDNKGTMYAIDAIYNAISAGTKVGFVYTEWDASKKKVPRKDGKERIVNPACLLWFDENYYLIAYDEKDEKIKYYRVDKMKDVNVHKEKCVGGSNVDKDEISRIAKGTFGMYSGDPNTVSVKCNKSLVGVFIDRFGTEIGIRDCGDDVIVRFDVIVSPQFFGWLAGLGTKCTVEGPSEVKKDYIEYLTDIINNY